MAKETIDVRELFKWMMPKAHMQSWTQYPNPQAIITVGVYELFDWVRAQTGMLEAEVNAALDEADPKGPVEGEDVVR